MGTTRQSLKASLLTNEQRSAANSTAKKTFRDSTATSYIAMQKKNPAFDHVPYSSSDEEDPADTIHDHNIPSPRDGGTSPQNKSSNTSGIIDTDVKIETSLNNVTEDKKRKPRSLCYYFCCGPDDSEDEKTTKQEIPTKSMRG